MHKLFLLLMNLVYADKYNLIVELKSSYSVIQVYENGPIRDLRINTRGTNTVESRMNMNNPLIPAVGYPNMMLVSLLWNPEPTDILVIGLGAAVLPRILRYYYPMTRIDIVEIDPNILRIAKEHFRFKTDPLMTVYINDARIFINSIKKTYDIILSDVYAEVDVGIPYHLRTLEYTHELKQRLKVETGVLLTHLQRNHNDYDSSRKIHEHVFKYNYEFVAKNCSFVILLSGFQSLTQSEMFERAAQLEQTKCFLFNLTYQVLKLEKQDLFDINAPILKDKITTPPQRLTLLPMIFVATVGFLTGCYYSQSITTKLFLHFNAASLSIIAHYRSTNGYCTQNQIVV
ncbi:unnamed protein product [Didymodactylos carnosus]|uniref:PABS domain-containing protein n=1 Tax=Didymodactylos carnosus TaxID=1234261 RepID=A0A814WDK3_9BILA|nr:unnamed protein product [Didymodactylos carnosus]CAF1200826.1 unnamed protein product [Didymodactylos carnosus]CAF3821169.1 unnamed protein product [Didymodactylos carnosus]CAF3965347.1 unnamed protein product [Didymodactylos carnosus]